ncbi:unnamed protein product [Meloidogyne enterolobii]|uniref:Uncharacterized protein n=1 Tax=Meloidogyne enterolobii TaxID=390850 RepID=A0ACB0ZZV1_MELEN
MLHIPKSENFFLRFASEIKRDKFVRNFCPQNLSANFSPQIFCLHIFIRKFLFAFLSINITNHFSYKKSRGNTKRTCKERLKRGAFPKQCKKSRETIKKLNDHRCLPPIFCL